MLDLDVKVEARTRQQGVAQFRFVDDYTILAQSFNKLETWTKWYRDSLERELGIKINLDKTVPPELGEYLLAKKKPSDLYSGARLASEVKSPTQLATRTLTQISILDQEDFDLLSHDTQSERLEQLRLLLLQGVDEAEIRADTRMSFAATRLANLAPRLASSEIGQLKSAGIARRIASLRYHEGLRGKAKKDLKRSINALQRKLQAALLKEQDSRMAAAGRIFHDLRVAFLQQPDKLKLLTGIIKFCRLSGYRGVRPILHPLLSKQTAQKRYLASVGLQALAKSTLLAVSTLQNPESLNREKIAAERHLTEIAAFGNVPTESSTTDKFYGDSWTFFHVSLASAVRLLSGNSQYKLLSRALTVCCTRLNIPLWAALIRKSKSGDWPVWLFFVERLWLSQQLVGPSPLWLRLAPKLEPSITLHWQLLRLYPKQQPALLNTLQTRRRKWNDSDAGWLRDAAEGNQKATLTKVRQIRVINRILKPSALDSSAVTIEEWVRFSASVEQENIFDPRCGEWTALELFKQILVAAARTGVEPTPFNVLFGKRLTSDFHLSNGTPPTWESWRSICKDVQVDLTKSKLRDYRMAFTSMHSVSNANYIPVTYGLLLSILLSRSLDLPSLWNLPGFSGARLGLIFSRIEHFAVSSATNVILEQCLAPRYIEYRAQAKRRTDSKLAVNKWVARLLPIVATAQEVLSEYQTTIQRFQSRQLIPVDIFQLRSQFGDTSGGTDG